MVDWEYLRGVAQDAGDWGEAELEQLCQALSGITKVRTRDKTPEKLELLFTLSQTVMMAKHTQVTALEDELGHLAEEAGKGDARREARLEEEIVHLQNQLQGQSGQEDIAYDWSSGWRLKKKEMEEAIQQKNLEIQQFMDDLQTCKTERAGLRISVAELEEQLADATKEINSITAEYLAIKETHSHLQESLEGAREEMRGFQSRVEELIQDKAQLLLQYQDLSNGVEARVDQLKVVVKQREEELQRLRSRVQERPPGPHTHTADHAQLSQLQLEVKEKDGEIEQLSQQLKEASKEIESSAALIVTLKDSKRPVKGDALVIKQLRGQLNDAQKMIQQMRTQLLAAEEDAQLHAQDLSTVMGELQSYLAGEYSLADAVRELKEARGQVRARDAQISQLTSLSNSLHININQLLDENSELREQLKLEPRADLDLPGVKKTHWQDTKKVIENLTAQVNKLQDDKVTLRTKIYELTRELSNAKGSLQLTSIELHKPFGSEVSGLQTQNLEEQINQLSMAVGQLVRGGQETSEARLRQQQEQQDELEELRERCSRLEGEKASLERIIHSSLTTGSQKKKKDDIKMTKVWVKEQEEEKEETGVVTQDDPPLSNASSPSHHDLSEAKKETKSPTAALDDLIAALGQLPPSTEEVIAKLKSQVEFLIKECDKREHEISEREKTAHIYTTQFEDLRAQAANLNILLSEEQEKWERERRKLEKTSGDLEDEVTALRAKVGELQVTLDDVASGRPDVEIKHSRRLAELRYDLEIAKRLSGNQKKEVGLLHQQLKDRLESLQHSLLQIKQVKHEGEVEKEILTRRVRRLEEELGRSIPLTAADNSAGQLAAITTKYRALLHHHTLQMKERQMEVEEEVERRQLLEERGELRQLLESAREKVHSLQASLYLLKANTTNIQVESLSKQLAGVEMRELRERQKADHATAMYATIKKEREEVVRRLGEVQAAHDAAAHMNQQLQTTVGELRHNSQQAVSKEEYARVTARVTSLEEEKGELSVEVRRLKAVVDVTGTQARQKEVAWAVERVEVEQLRQENRDLAAVSDPRTIISCLHHDITTMKVKILELTSALEEVEGGMQKAEAEVWGLRQQVRQRDRLIETSTQDARARATRLHLIITDLRLQYAGAVPLTQQERLVEELTSMREEQASLQVALRSALNDKMESRVVLRQLQVKQEALEELKAALVCPSDVSDHMAGWCDRLKEVRLANAELEEKLRATEETQAVCESRLEARERRIIDLQTQLTALEKTWTDAQLVWDEREAELTHILQEHRDTLTRVSLDMPTLIQKDAPDSSLPLASQLQQALDTIQVRVTQLDQTRAEMKKWKSEAEAAQTRFREKEIEVLARDKVINELRSLGSSSEGFISVGEETPYVKFLREKEGREVKTSKAEDEPIKAVVEGLRERLRLSHDTVTHYQNLLTKEHEKQLALIAHNKKEMARVSKDREDALVKLRQAQTQLDNIPTHDHSSQALREAHVSQLQSLEEAVQLSEGQLEEARNQVNACEKKIVQLERDLAITRRQHAEEREQLEVSGQVRVQQHQREVDRLSGELVKLRGERDDLQGELSMMKEGASRTPSAIMRTLVEKLRDQLIEKEKQVAKLTIAVQEAKERMLEEDSDGKGPQDSITFEKEISRVTSKVTETFRVEVEKLTTAKDGLEKQLSQQNISLTELMEKSSKEAETLKEEIKGFKSDKLKIEKQLLQQKNANSTMKQKLLNLEGKSPEAVARTIESLQEKLEKMKGKEEVKESEYRRAHSQEQVIRWEERKKLKGTIDKLKSRVKELETSNEISARKLETSRDLLGKVEREKLSLQQKLVVAGRAATQRLCRVCLKTLTSVDMGEGDNVVAQEWPSTSFHVGHTPTRQQRRNKVSPSPERAAEGGKATGKDGRAGGSDKIALGRDQRENDGCSPHVYHKCNWAECESSKTRMKKQLKVAVEDKHSLESRLQGAVEEVTALRSRLQQKEEEEARLLAERNSLMGRTGGPTGAALVMQYEGRIAVLEEEIRQKARLLTHVKQVVREAAGREEGLRRERDSLASKVALLEGISEDTPAARLIQELRQAKLTITRLQRQLDLAREDSTPN
ncbi:hypothetical protein Pmani_005256 [Petrolisthes manimaculis]|uniref:Centrosomal protein of 290kDa coiled-coil region domain-containing protein n=1 Tax=Petrolisthes manimaculis TaxID=1843537 RepID=A0AAE1QCU8_9EUCA|nr:hypothetical protein Pmani_005256 [Petrolisthes manimaculis]